MRNIQFRRIVEKNSIIYYNGEECNVKYKLVIKKVK